MERASFCSASNISRVEGWKQNVDFGMDVSGLDESDLPAYSPTAEDGAFPGGSNSCCALQVLNERLQDHASRGHVMQQDPRHQFVCWVALCRTTDPDISVETRRSCPFQWCEYKADDTDGVELLNHVTSCFRFAEGRYVCPYHCRPESFMQPQKRSRLSKPARRHFLKYAFNAIYRLGSKSLHKAIHPSKLNSVHRNHHHHDERRESKKRRRDTEFSIPTLPGIELDSTAVTSEHSFSASQPLPVRVARYGLDAAELPNRRTQLCEMEGILPAAELASKRFSSASSESALATNPSASSASSPISPVTSESWYSYTGFDSPISPADTSFHFQQFDDNKNAPDISSHKSFTEDARCSSHDSSLPAWFANQSRSWSPSRSRNPPQIRIDTSCSGSRIVDGVLSPSVSKYLEKTPSPLQIEAQAQIEAQTRDPVKLEEELRGLFNTLFKVSCTKLTQPPPCPTITTIYGSYNSAASMFELAWKAMAKIVKGSLPNTFPEIFAVAHLGYACALGTQELDLVSQFQPIYDDLKRWSGAITSGQDKHNYLTLIQKLFSPETLGTRNLEELLDHETNLLTPTPLNRAYLLRPRSSALRPSESKPFEDTNRLSITALGADELKELYISLRNGPVVRFCVQFLNIFEYLSSDSDYDSFYPSFVDVNDPPLATDEAAHNYYVLSQDVIDQLLAMRGVESFRPVVDGAAMLLNTNTSTTLRELELYLIYEGRNLARNQSMYRKFVETINQLCDRAFVRLSGQRKSRIQHLTKDIDRIIGLHHDLLRNERGDAHWPSQQIQVSNAQSILSASSSSSAIAQDHPLSMASIQPAFSWIDTPTSTSSASPSTNTAGFLAPDLPSDALFDPAPGIEFGDPHFPTPNQASFTTATSSKQTGQDPSAIETGEGSMECRVCGKVLQGKLIYLASNMQRHIREQHRPDARKLVCMIDGCGKAFGRNSNLVQHQKAVHPAQLQESEDAALLN